MTVDLLSCTCDSLRFFKFGCVVDYDAHTAFFGVGGLLLLLECVVIKGLLLIQRSRNQGESQHRLRKLVNYTLLFSYFA